MQAEPSDENVCTECGASVLVAVTTKKSKGQPVKVVLEIDETETGEVPASEWIVNRYAGKLHAGQPGPVQRAGMLKDGIKVHLEHEPKCARYKALNRFR